MRRNLLQILADGIVIARSPDLEPTDQARQLCGLLRQRMARRSRLLDHGRILLRHLVHLVDRGAGLLGRRRLLLRAAAAIPPTTSLISLTWAMICSSDLPANRLEAYLDAYVEAARIRDGGKAAPVPLRRRPHRRADRKADAPHRRRRMVQRRAADMGSRGRSAAIPFAPRGSPRTPKPAALWKTRRR
jgi:hypothetical protein